MNASAATPWRVLYVLSALVALALSAGVVRWGILPGEVELRAVVRSLASPRAVDLAHAISEAGTWRGLVPAMLILLALSAHARRRWWLWCGLFALTLFIGEVWQELVGRPRPHGSALGFPSGHAIGVATYTVLVLYLAGRARLAPPWRLGIAVMVGAAMVVVGLARIVRDSHWAADVVVGFALGSAGAAAAAWWDLTHPLPASSRARNVTLKKEDAS